MKLFHLRHVDWIDSQLIYHAMPRVGVEGILLLAPRSPYVCIGYHQNLEQEIDLEYCEKFNIPVFRREVGGGAVFLDGDQIFFQIVIHKDKSLNQSGKSEFYERLLQPVVDTYCELGVPTKFRPVNDVVTLEGRKIAGTGVVEIGDYIVLVGNLIADFDYETMVKVLRVPDEKYRDKVFNSMHDNLTTIKRELGYIPSWDEMADTLLRNFAVVLGTLEMTELPQKVLAEMERIKPGYLSDAWLFKKRRESANRNVKIASNVNIVHRVHKAPGGLIRSTFELKNGILSDISLSGDFFSYPSDAITKLEVLIEGATSNEIDSRILEFYANNDVEIPGVSPNDWKKVLT